ncbi:hypothetical protein SVXHr_2732 [Halorhabdus sp. SVX81]|uniref:hypothetical protein n=1 Tax=Halorhabdus sp. SVX81 TaxID=2978283 RepID=UPI0023DC8A70|nr:hypothetical protein [Halorhabdus sp. SVX81]WEL18875.1 hypothetical protein SVXHr_2732 [Halorhabdus sp. SVX81]
MSERATIRPVTLARLVEVTNACSKKKQSTEDVEIDLEVSHRRARETLLEACRIGLIDEDENGQDDPQYSTTKVGKALLDAVRAEDWRRVSSILQTRSPHYGAFLQAVDEVGPEKPQKILEELEIEHEHSPYDFNQTSIEVIGDWGERLGTIQRNAFTGTYYRVNGNSTPPNFPFVLLSVFDDLEETAGVNLSQRYVSIPKLREYVCEHLNCTRNGFDDSLLSLVRENIGKLELSGAPMDTGAKKAKLGIKQIELADTSGLVSTDQSTDSVMRGVEQFGKQYYYLAVHDENITHSQVNNE